MSQQRSGKLARLKHAFAVDPPQTPTPAEDERAAVESVCRRMDRLPMLHMPIQIALHTCRPLNYIGAACGHIASPVVKVVTGTFGFDQSYDGYQSFLKFLERRGSLEYLSDRLTELSEQRKQRRSKEDEATNSDPNTDRPDDGANGM